MTNKLFRWYFRTSLVLRILACFAAGSVIGGLLWYVSRTSAQPITQTVMPYISPFGTVFVDMLKMIVVPVIFFSLVVGAASLPISKFGRIGLKTLGWYLSCSVLAAIVGVCLALLINPGSGTDLEQWQQMAGLMETEAQEIAGQAQT